MKQLSRVYSKNRKRSESEIQNTEGNYGAMKIAQKLLTAEKTFNAAASLENYIEVKRTIAITKKKKN